MYPSFIHDITEIFARDLDVLADEVTQTKDENLWLTVPGINNSVGTLALHICGNLRYFVGAVIGEDGFIRNREAEFSNQPISKSEILSEINATKTAVKSALGKLNPSNLSKPMRETPPQHMGRSVGFFLIQLSCHFSRHRGQLDYLRRMLSAR